MRAELAAFALAVALSGAGCSSTPKPDPVPVRPVRFAVLAAPEVGADDGDLALAMTRISLRAKELSFVLVPGPLLAKDADKVALELLKNDLGQIAPPVYVAFTAGTSSAAVGSATVAAPGSSLTGDEILTAVEGMGPGPKHQIAYHHAPSPGVVVDVVAGDGSGALGTLPEGTKRLVRLSAGAVKALAAGDPVPDLVVTVGPTIALRAAKDATASLEVAPLGSCKAFVIVTMHPIRIEAEVVPIDGGASRALESVPLRAKDD